MKITKVEALPVSATMQPLRIATTEFNECCALIVKVFTDIGLTGLGEGLVREAPKATSAIVDNMLAPRIIGEDPINIAGLWWKMFSAMRTRGHTKGHFLEAISAIDVALWDIVGKFQNLPVYKVLNGYGRNIIPAYASSVFIGDIKDMESQTQKFLDLGYKDIKIKLGMGINKDVEAVSAIRKLTGEDIRLMVDVNSVYDSSTAIRLGRKLEKYEIEWIEEPVPPYDYRGYREVKSNQPIPIAGGEGEFSLYGFRDFLNTGAVDIVQPDLARVGGFTEGMRITALIQAHNLRFAPHTGMCSALNIISSMHFAAAAPNFLRFEFMELEHPLMDIFTTPLPRPVKGKIELQEDPGLGIELDMEKLGRWIQE